MANAPVQRNGAALALSSSAAVTVSGVRIVRPVDGATVALDPDIPPAHQRVQLSASAVAGAAQPLRWQMDGRALGAGAQLAWMPWPGRHVVQLLDAHGTVLDQVRLEVRGAGARSAAP